MSCGDSRHGAALTIREFSPKERAQAALKMGALCLVVLLVVACIPGAHFVLVPLVLLLSPWLIYRTWRVKSEIEGGEMRCARCQGELTRLTSRERYPMYERCLVCQRENSISLDEGYTTSNTCL